MISISQLSVHFTGTYIFDNVSFIINDRDRIGLTGKNGAGKTTLMKIIAGLMEAEKGDIAIPSETTIGYLPQELTIESSKTIIEETLTAFSSIFELKKLIESLTDEISRISDYQSDKYARLIERLHTANEQYNFSGGDNISGNTEKVLLGLGFRSEDFNRSISEFSGGWKMRVEIAKLLLQEPGLLLLDEPTNHLDIESIQWLESFLASYKGAVVLVSHDRAFLDNVCKRTIEISLGKIYDYKAKYSDYVSMREERIGQQLSAFNNQQKQIEHIEKFVERFRYKATKARQVQSRLKMLEKIDLIEVDEVDSSSIKFLFPQAPPSGKLVFEADKLSKSYGTHNVFDQLSFSVNQGDKIAFVGRNGEGKTTLARILVGDLDYEGSLNTGHNVMTAYYAQNQTELLDQEKTVFETIDDVATGEMRPKVRALLGSFLFGGETIDKKVKVLSGGEKSRLALCKMLLSPINLLVLDEPTNHLDMLSKDILKNALIKYKGTLIIVSHDRDFLQGLTNRLFEFSNGNVKQYIGDVYDFLESRRLKNLKDLEQSKKELKSLSIQDEPSRNKISREKKKEVEKEIRKISGAISRLEKTIEETELKIKQIDSILSNPDLHSESVINHETYQEYEQLKASLAEDMVKWEEMHKKMEDIKQNDV